MIDVRLVQIVDETERLLSLTPDERTRDGQRREMVDALAEIAAGADARLDPARRRASDRLKSLVRHVAMRSRPERPL